MKKHTYIIELLNCYGNTVEFLIEDLESEHGIEAEIADVYQDVEDHDLVHEVWMQAESKKQCVDALTCLKIADADERVYAKEERDRAEKQAS